MSDSDQIVGDKNHEKKEPLDEKRNENEKEINTNNANDKGTAVVG